MPKILILASKMESFFAVFGYQNRPLEAPWAHQGVQTENPPKIDQKSPKISKKMIQNYIKKYPKMFKKMSRKKQSSF